MMHHIPSRPLELNYRGLNPELADAPLKTGVLSAPILQSISCLLGILEKVVSIHIVVITSVLVVIWPVLALIVHIVVVAGSVELVIIIVVQIIVVCVLCKAQR